MADELEKQEPAPAHSAQPAQPAQPTPSAQPDSYPAPTATVSSLKSEDSTQQLLKPKSVNNIVKKQSDERSKSVELEAGQEKGARTKIVVLLGLTQVVLGALLVGAGALAVVKGAALARVGAGLWAGAVAVVAGVVGVLAGINDCHGLVATDKSGGAGAGGGSPMLTAFLALSLLCVACGNSAAVLAATGLHRDSHRAEQHHTTFQDEMEAWTPALTNISVLIIASLHCVVSVVTVCQIARRVCPCLRVRTPYDHNQFDPTYKVQQLVVVNETSDLCKNLEGKLQDVKKKDEVGEFGTANSKEKLVSHWLGRQTVGSRRRGGRKPRQAPLVLLPHPAHASRVMHPSSTLGRMPVGVVLPPRYATLPLPPAGFAHPLYYPVHDARMRRRRSPREAREAWEARGRRRGRSPRARDSHLTRSLERIHRKRRLERDRITDADLKRTYTGLDRAYAEQFIAVCDESRHAHAAQRHDSLGTDSSDSSHRDSL